MRSNGLEQEGSASKKVSRCNVPRYAVGSAASMTSSDIVDTVSLIVASYSVINRNDYTHDLLFQMKYLGK